MKLSIVIVNWNGADYLNFLLNSLFKNKPKCSFEVIIINNSYEKLKLKYPVKLIQNEINVGFAKANNEAIKLSKAEYILLLNPDTLVLPNSIDILVNYLDQNKKTGIVGPMLLNKDKSIQPSVFAFPHFIHAFFEVSSLNKFFPKNKLFKKYLGYLGKYLKTFANYTEHNKIRKVDFVSGACMLIRKDIFKEFGLFDEYFFIYHEEMELSYRIRKKYGVVFLPSAKIIHFNDTTMKNNNLIFNERIKGLFYFYKKYHRNLFFYYPLFYLALIINSFFFNYSSNQNFLTLRSLQD